MSTEASWDVISIKSLALPHPITLPDNWDKAQKKPQPALLNIKLTLAQNSFKSAASGDQLNQQTVHYGELSKAIRKVSVDGQDLTQVFTKVSNVFAQYTAIQQWQCEVCLPKGSMFGTQLRVNLAWSTTVPEQQALNSWAWVVEGISVPCLIGVNANERTGRQPVIVEFEIDNMTHGTPATGVPQFVIGEIFVLEKALIEVSDDDPVQSIFSRCRTGLINHDMLQTLANLR